MKLNNLQNVPGSKKKVCFNLLPSLLPSARLIFRFSCRKNVPDAVLVLVWGKTVVVDINNRVELLEALKGDKHLHGKLSRNWDFIVIYIETYK